MSLSLGTLDPHEILSSIGTRGRRRARPSSRRGPSAPVRTSVALAVVCCLLPIRAAAQDSHYWNLQYGPVGELLGGTIVGSAVDLSSTFYNPGGLAMSDDPAFLLSVRAFQNESLTLDFGEGRSDNLSGGSFGGVPSLLAGSLPSGWLGEDTRLAWSFLTRRRFNVRVVTRVSSERGFRTPPSRFDTVTGELLFDQRMSEEWGGLTLSRPIGKTVGVGVTQYLVYRSQRARSEVSAQGVAADGTGGAVLFVDEWDYATWRTLTKLGLAVERRPFSFGLSVTTPSVALAGSGASGFTRSLTASPDPGAPSEAVLAERYAEGLDSDYRSPLSVALGAKWERGATRLYLSGEWFDSVPRFQVLEVDTGLPPTDWASGPEHVHELDSVFNVGVGVAHTFGNGVDVYASISTDASAAVDEANTALSDWDILHLTGGVAFSFGSHRFTLGLAYATGGKDTVIAILPEEVQDAVGIDLAESARFDYGRLKFIIGFVFGS